MNTDLKEVGERTNGQKDQHQRERCQNDEGEQEERVGVKRLSKNE